MSGSQFLQEHVIDRFCDKTNYCATKRIGTKIVYVVNIIDIINKMDLINDVRFTIFYILNIIMLYKYCFKFLNGLLCIILNVVCVILINYLFLRQYCASALYLTIFYCIVQFLFIYYGIPFMIKKMGFSIIDRSIKIEPDINILEESLSIMNSCYKITKKLYTMS